MENFFKEKPVSQQLGNTNHWENITAAECKSHYFPDWDRFPSDRGSVIVVVDKPAERKSMYLGSVWLRVSEENRPAIQYCLSLRVPPRCRLQVHLWFLVTVIIFTIIKITCMALTLREQAGNPIMTVGDAVASFLERPCPKSAGFCMHSEEELMHVLRERRIADGILKEREFGVDEEDVDDERIEERRVYWEGPRIWQKKVSRYHSSMSPLLYLTYSAS